MKVSSLATFALGIVALSASIAACSTTNNNAVQHTSALGESCLTTGDCMGSHVCVSNVCTAAAAPAGDGGGSSSGRHEQRRQQQRRGHEQRRQQQRRHEQRRQHEQQRRNRARSRPPASRCPR